MTFDDALTELREDILRDTVQDYRFSDAQLMRFYNKAVAEVCERVPVLFDSAALAVTASSSSLTLDKEVRKISRAVLLSTGYNVHQATEIQIREKYGERWAVDTGNPRYFMRQNTALTLYPKPEANDSITFYYSRVPLESELITSGADEAAVPEQYHYALLHWAAYLCFMSPDADAFDQARANQYAQMFYRVVGPRKSAQYDAISLNTPAYAAVLPGRFV